MENIKTKIRLLLVLIPNRVKNEDFCKPWMFFKTSGFELSEEDLKEIHREKFREGLLL